MRTFAMIVVISLIWLSATLAADSPGTLIDTLDDPMTLAGFGVRQPSDIKEVVITYMSGSKYKLTQQDTPELVERLYKAISELGSLTAAPPGDWDTILISKNNDESAMLVFYSMPSPEKGAPDKCFIGGTANSMKLDSVLHDAKRNAKAASLGAGVGSYQTKELLVRWPNSGPVKVPLPSKEGKALIAKAQAIINCLDLRSLPAELDLRTLPVEPVTSESLGQAELKFGSVYLMLDEPIKLRLYNVTQKDTKDIRPRSGGFIIAIRPVEVICNTFIVMDYGNLQPPVVILRDRVGIYYLYNSLTRREQERAGVVEYGLPGHPSGDTAYYKNPKIFFRELQELMKTTYNKFK